VILNGVTAWSACASVIYVRGDGKKVDRNGEVFLKLTPEQRAAKAEKRLDETLERVAGIHHISAEQGYERLIRNRHEVH